MPLDFAQYKPRLGDFLRARGIDYSTGNFRCFAHDDGHVPSKWSMHLYGERVICYGCGFNGDIYDVVGVMDGIDDIGEQYKAVEAFFSGKSVSVDAYKMESTAPERFAPDLSAIDSVRDYMVSIRGNYRSELAAFARNRGFPDDYGYKLVWWPGLDVAGPVLGREILENAGIVEPGKDRGAWSFAGVALKVGLGFKLHYIGSDGATIKRESRGGHTFPFPALPDNDTLILVEGELDAVSCRYAGIDAVSIGGLNGISGNDASTILGFPCIILLCDNDSPGRTALGLEPPKYKRYKTIPQLLREGGYTGEIRYVDWSQNEAAQVEKDADDLVKHDKVYVLRQLIQNAVLWEESANGQTSGPIAQDIRVEETSGNAGDAVDGIGNDSGPADGLYQPNDSGSEKDNRAVEPTGLATIPREAIPFQFLGFDKEAYYVLPKRQNIALKISRGDKAIKDKLNEVAHPDWWFDFFQHEVPDPLNGGMRTVFDSAAALNWFRHNQVHKGMYDDDLLLGTGAHYDEGKVIVNTGKGVCTPSGEWSTYEAYTGHNTYCRSPHELVIGDKPWAVGESQYFLDQLHTFSFDSPFSYYAISGFCALAPFASMLRRRPHIWITGQKGEGKSVLLRDVIYPVIGEGYSVYKEGLTTEAAFRQNLKRDNRPIINDEFEINRREDQSTIDGVLTLSRIAYSGESVSKGTSNQQGVSFTTKIMFCFASINVNIRNDADRSRIIVCRMQESRGRMKSIRNIDGLRGRMFLRLDSLNHNIELAHDLIEDEGHDSRTADTHAPFLAAHWMMTNETPFAIGNDHMIGEMKEALSTIGLSDERTTDEDRILVRIFQEKVHLSPDTDFTIAEMLNKKDDLQNPIFDNELQRLGIRRKTGTEKEGCGGIEILCIVSKHDSISKMLAETPFTNYKEVLKRNTAYIGSRPVHIGGQSQSALIFRWDVISMKYFEEEENKEKVPF